MGATTAASAIRNASISRKCAPVLSNPAATNHAAAAGDTGRHPVIAVAALATVTTNADQNNIDMDVSVRARRRVMRSRRAFEKAAATGISSAHSKVVAPGRTTITTPAKPTTMAIQRAG